MRFTPIRLLAFDRRNAGMHEGAHYVVAVHFGITDLAACIYQRTDNPLIDTIEEVTWLGHFASDRKEMDRLSPFRRTVIAVAGGVGESLWRYGPGEWEDALERVSPGDWSRAGHGPDDTAIVERAIQEASRLLRGTLKRNWNETGRQLITFGRIGTSPTAMLATMLAITQV